MGGCASKPRDLDITSPVLVEAPVVPETPVAAPEEAKEDGAETKKEKPSVDSSEPVPAVQAETEPAKAEAKPVEEEPKEEKKEVA